MNRFVPKMTPVIRHVFAMHVPVFGRSLKLPLTLEDLAAAGFAPATPMAAGVAATPPSTAARAAVPPASGPAAPKPRNVAITFDDGPHPEGTPQVLEALARHDALATFFLVGEQVVKRPELARRIVEAGHAVGLHGHLHRPHPMRTTQAMAADFERGTAAIADAVGFEPRLHRPPYGIYSPASLRIARERGLQPLLWSKWGKDWRKVTTPEQITARVVSGLRPGDVILLHDADYYSARLSHRRTAAAVPAILNTLQSGEIGTVALA